MLDLRRLNFIDSAGLGRVLAVQRRASRAGRRLVVVRGCRAVERLFALSALRKCDVVLRMSTGCSLELAGRRELLQRILAQRFQQPEARLSRHAIRRTNPGPITSRARIAVAATDASGNVGSDISDADASIVSGTAAINVSQPNTALAWAIGTTQQIKWTHNLGVSSWVSVELSRDDGATWTTIAAAVKNATVSSGSVTWTVTSPATTRGRVRVSALNAPIADVSDAAFAIAAPVITVTQPNTTVTWVIGSTQTIRWTHNVGLNTPMEVALSRNGGSTWTTLAASVPNSGSTSGSYTWVVTGGATTQGRVRVTWRPALYPAVKDVSDVNFRIVNP